MPKTKTDFSITPVSFYKFVCKNEEIKSCYVGHTINFRSRKSSHKNSCIKPNNKKHNLKIYQTIRENGGWNNWAMIEISSRLCSSERDAERVEQEYISDIKADMNSRRAFSTDKYDKEYQKQYAQDHKEQICEYQKQYNQDHKEQIKQYREANKDKISEYQKQYAQDNKEKLKEYREANKEQISEKNKQYYLKQKELKMIQEEIAIIELEMCEDFMKIADAN